MGGLDWFFERRMETLMEWMPVGDLKNGLRCELYLFWQLDVDHWARASFTWGIPENVKTTLKTSLVPPTGQVLARVTGTLRF